MSIIRNSIASLLCAGLVAVASPCGAQPFAQLHTDRATKPVTVIGGFITAGIGLGSGFTEKHPGKGQYVLKFQKGLFTGIPVFTCTAYGQSAPPPICVVKSVNWPQTNAVTTVELNTFDSQTILPMNSDLEFIGFTTNVQH